jgi:hypothetical protein
MSSIDEQMSGNPKAVDIGRVTGSATCTQFPDRPIKTIRFKAGEENVGIFLIGSRSNECYFPLGAGDDSGWIPANNMNEYYYSDVSGSLDHLNYWRLY